MKTRFRILVSLMLTACLLGTFAACSAPKTQTVQEPAPAAEPASLDTMGDVFFYDSYDNGFSEKHFVYVFEKDGVTYRAVADLPADVSEALFALDFFDEHRDEKVRELVGPLPVARIDNLTEQIPDQEELNSLIGKTGQELRDEGWILSGWQLDDMTFTMEHGPFAYEMVMEGDYVPNENYDFDEDADFGPLKVKSVTCVGFGDAIGDVLNEEPEA